MLAINGNDLPDTSHTADVSLNARERLNTRAMGMLSSENPILPVLGELHVRRTSDWRVIHDRSWVMFFQSPCRGIMEYHETAGERAWHQLFSRTGAIRWLNFIGADPRTIDMDSYLRALCPDMKNDGEWQRIEWTNLPPPLGLHGFYDWLTDKAFCRQPNGYYWSSSNGGILNQWVAIHPFYVHPNFFPDTTDDLFLSVAYSMKPGEPLSH